MSEAVEGIPVEHGKELAKFSPSEQAIAGYRAKYLPIRVADPTDKANAALARAGRLEVKKTRCAVEAIRKDLKADALKFGQAVDSEARRITAELERIETHLQEQEDIVAKHEARLAAEAAAKAEAERIEAERIREEERLALIAKVEAMEREKREAEEREAKRIADEAAKAEQERLAKAREEQAAREAVAAAERAAAEREAALKAQAEREVARIKAEAEAREKVIRDEAARIAAAAEAERARKEAEDIARAKAEAARPDKEKLYAFAASIAAMEPPEVATPEAEAVRVWIVAALARLSEAIKSKI
jgi:hypothetical protein